MVSELDKLGAKGPVEEACTESAVSCEIDGEGVNSMLGGSLGIFLNTDVSTVLLQILISL